MRHRRKVMAAMVVALLAAIAVEHPSADIRILTHEESDPAPHRMQAALDTGLFAVHLLVTWTGKALH